MNLLSFLPGVLKTIGDITGIGIIKDAANALSPDQVKALPPDVQAQLQQAAMKHEEAMRAADLEDLKAFISESMAEINSADKYTSRARPTGVYAATLITTILAVGMLWGVKLDTGAVVTLMVPLWGSAAYYTSQRTAEKIAAIKPSASS